MIQQTVTHVCRKSNNYFVPFLYSSVSSVLLQELNRYREARFASALAPTNFVIHQTPEYVVYLFKMVLLVIEDVTDLELNR
jgi:hypothetical protein